VNSAPALLLAAAGVGFGHAVLPDHWAPLAVLGRTRREPLGRTVRRSLAAAGTHVALSLVLGALLIAVGLGLRSAVVRYEDLIVGGLLVVTGATFFVLEFAGRGHGHPHPHPHPHDHEPAHQPTHPHTNAHTHAHPHPHAHPDVHPRPDPRPLSSGRARGLAAVVVPFGAAASPDLTILPVFLAASALGGVTAFGSLLVFGLVTVATMVGLTVAASLGAARVTAPWIERRANLLTAGTLLVLGAAIAVGLL
jgi:nickel/cobalt exporter